jgi:protein-disulfide isomerase
MDQIKKLFNSQKLVFGDKNAKVLFTEFSDPSCPYCHIAAGKNPELSQQANFQYKDQGGTYVPPVTEMRNLVDQGKAGYALVYFPGHGNGQLGQEALYCAQEKGKFWDVHDLLMTNDGYNLLNNDVKNDKANSQKLVDFLANAVDPVFLKDCIDSEKYKAQLSKDTTLAQSFGVQGTPGFFVNSTAFNGAYSFTDMESAVKTALGE